MSWSEFYIIVSGLIAFVFLLVAFPWLRKKDYAKSDNLSNTQVVKQRLKELERERREGLISEQDMNQAVDELKVALVDESDVTPASHGSAHLPLVIGAVIALSVGIWVYASVNQISKVERASQAIEALPQLSEQLASGDASNFTEQDIVNLTLAIRQRLRDTPNDDTGWMYLGRLMLTLGQEVQAIEAIDKAVAITPQNTSHRVTLTQALMTTGDVNNLRRAQQILADLLAESPENDNLALMMAVVSAQLGDLDNLVRYYQQVEGKLPADNDIGQRLAMRIQELQRQFDEIGNSAASGTSMPLATDEKTGFQITINASDEALAALPENGFLIVFAQDALSENRMPAAVVKVPLQDFPVTLTLNTDNAMMPQYTLDTLSKVTLTARVSADGNVSVSPGEWEGSVVSDVAQNEVVDINILIGKELL